MNDPYKTPESELLIGDDQNREAALVRTGQKMLIYAVLINIPMVILIQLHPLAGLFLFVALGTSIYGLIKLFQGMKLSFWSRVLLFICMFIPLINLLVISHLSGRATKILKAAGYKVGLLGAFERVA